MENKIDWNSLPEEHKNLFKWMAKQIRIADFGYELSKKVVAIAKQGEGFCPICLFRIGHSTACPYTLAAHIIAAVEEAP